MPPSEGASNRHGAWPSVGPSYPGPSSAQGSSRGGRGRGRGSGGGGGDRRGGGARGARGGRGRGPRGQHPGDAGSIDDGKTGSLVCGHVYEQPLSQQSSEPPQPPCQYRTNSAFNMTLHKADRHLVYPPGGKEQLDRMDPLLAEERRDAERRAKKRRQANENEAGPALSVEEEEAKALQTIPGLNISLSTPELIEQWIAERKKRWPSDKVVEKKQKEAWDDTSRGQLRRHDKPQPQTQTHEPAQAPVSAGTKRKRTQASGDGDQAGSDRASSSDSDSESDSDADSDSDSSSDSGSDAPSEEPIRKDGGDDGDGGDDDDRGPSPVRSTRPDICRFFLPGRCSYGAHCRQSHDAGGPSQSQSQSQAQGTAATHSGTAALAHPHPQARPASHIPAHRRPRPRNPPPNPFEPRNLLHALLKDEITQHVSAVAQVVRFLVRNDFLKGVEFEPGLAEEQQRRRELIQEVRNAQSGDTGLSEETAPAQQLDEPEGLQPPLADGALPTLESEDSSLPTAMSASTSTPSTARSLYRPPSPTLRPLTSLSWPPEPDPLIFLDPLRRNDPKPLTRLQFARLSTDAALRSILRPCTSLHPGGEPRPGLERALKTLDGLPSDAHRRAALELILGVSPQTPAHPHQIGNTFVSPGSGPTGGDRFIGEVELFRLGLRCGQQEQAWIREVGKRVSELVEGGPRFDVEPSGWGWDVDAGGASSASVASAAMAASGASASASASASAGGPGRDAEPEWAKREREEARRRYWAREADRRDVLRKLGVDVD